MSAVEDLVHKWWGRATVPSWQQVCEELRKAIEQDKSESVPSELGRAISKANEYLARARKAEDERRYWMQQAIKFSDDYHDELERRLDVEAELSVAKGNSLNEWRREYRRGRDDALRNVAKRIENHRIATRREDGYNGGLQYAREIAKGMLNEVSSDTYHDDRGNPL